MNNSFTSSSIILAQAAPAEGSGAQEGAEGGGGLFGNPLIMMGLMFVIFWVLLIRPQQKQRKELAARQAALKKGDKVVTAGGMHGTVNAVSEKTVSLKLGDGLFVKFDKTAISAVFTEISEPASK